MKTSNDPKQLRGCGVYIFDDSGERVLLAQRGPAARHEQFKWEGPGGAVDEGESYEDACRREIREELGVDVTLGDLIWEYDEVIDSNGDIICGRSPYLPSTNRGLLGAIEFT
jgi:8-oxo-dGTP pyrophosphatase MutT (NUDIX family)